jgi:hypothetical protein
VTAKTRLPLSIGFVVCGIAIIYYASSGFSGAADFRTATSIIPTSMLPVFVVGVIMLALGLIQLLDSFHLKQEGGSSS